MGNTNGRSNPAPRKLEIEMAVVVMFKPDYPLMSWEIESGIVAGIWLKAKIVGVSKEKWYSMDINKDRIVINSRDTIIIRSTAIADNLQPGEVKLRIARAAANQAKRLASKQ